MDNPYHDRSISRMPSPIHPLETLTTSHFQFDEDVYALYLTYSRTFGALTASAGLRGEYWKSQVRSLLQEDGTGGYRHLNDSLNVFPSASLIWRVDRDRSLMLSYSSRVARPDTRQLNPNAVSTNPARPSVGNPFLRPEYNHSLELTFHGVWDELDVSLSAYYNYNQDVIQSYLTPIHPVTGEQTRGVLYNTYRITARRISSARNSSPRSSCGIAWTFRAASMPTMRTIPGGEHLLECFGINFTAKCRPTSR